VPKALSQDQVDQFASEGYICPIDVVEPHVAEGWRRQLEAVETSNGGPLKGPMRFKSHLLFKWLADLVRFPAIVDPIEDLIGPNILVWSTDWWIKEARSPSFVSWHQDSQYWGLDTSRLVTAWVALSPSTAQSGCMRVLPGSHLGPDLHHEDTFHDDNMLTRGQRINDVDESKTVNLEVNTGQASLFAFRVAHASRPNTSGDRRIGMAIRYIPADARQTRSDHDTATLVRGVNEFNHFDLEPEPACDFDPVAVEFHQRADEARRAILYKGTGRTAHRT